MRFALTTMLILTAAPSLAGRDRYGYPFPTDRSEASCRAWAKAIWAKHERKLPADWMQIMPDAIEFAWYGDQECVRGGRPSRSGGALH
jgi:hypothetical protein